VWTALTAALASLQTKHTAPVACLAESSCAASGSLVPYMVINTGMLPHQFSSFLEGLFGGLRSEFERTPKAAACDEVTERPAVTKRYGDHAGKVCFGIIPRRRRRTPYPSGARQARVPT
jgi:hypothetical protein